MVVLPIPEFQLLRDLTAGKIITGTFSVSVMRSNYYRKNFLFNKNDVNADIPFLDKLAGVTDTYEKTYASVQTYIQWKRLPNTAHLFLACVVDDELLLRYCTHAISIYELHVIYRHEERRMIFTYFAECTGLKLSLTSDSKYVQEVLTAQEQTASDSLLANDV